MQAKAEEERCEEESHSQQQRIDELMSAVRKFGRLPLEHVVTEYPKLEEERKLAHDVRKALQAERLSPAFVSELEAMQAKGKQQQIHELMSAVRKLGRFLVEHAVTEDPKLEEERKLARRVPDALQAERLPPAFVSELEAMQAKAEEERCEEESHT